MTDSEKIYKKVLVIVLLFIYMTFSFAMPSFAYNVPDETYYIKANTNEIGRVMIFVPYNYGKYFSSSGDSIVSTYGGTISCWGTTDTGITQYDIRFPFSDTPQYRVSNYNYSDLTINSIIDTNLPLLNDTDFTLISQGNIVNMIMVFIGGSLLLFTILKKG